MCHLRMGLWTHPPGQGRADTKAPSFLALVCRAGTVLSGVRDFKATSTHLGHCRSKILSAPLAATHGGLVEQTMVPETSSRIKA